MTTSLKNPSFDYSALSKDEKSKLIYFEGQLDKCRARFTDEVLKMGEHLSGARETLAAHRVGVFRAWLASRGIAHQSAYNAIAAYTEFANCPTVGQLEVSAMYALAKNEPAKKKALKLADQGKRVTGAMAKKLVAEAKAKQSHGASDGEDGRTDADEQDAHEEHATRPPGKGKEKPGGDLGKCPNCGKSKWTTDAFGAVCAKCKHPHGEPTGGTDDDQIATQRAKTKKTAEALMRAFDDLHFLSPSSAHEQAIADCQRLWAVAQEWK